MLQNILCGIKKRQKNISILTFLVQGHWRRIYDEDMYLTKFTAVLEKRIFLDSFLRSLKTVFIDSHMK